MANNHEDALKKIIPFSLGGFWDDDLEIEGEHLDTVRDVATTLLVEFFGDSVTLETISEWERVYDIVPESTDTLQDRQNILVARISDQGGQSRQYYIDLMTGFGETASITEAVAFRAGFSVAGDPVYDLGQNFVWTLTFTGWTGNTRQAVVEDLINKLKPAHTQALFVYS